MTTLQPKNRNQNRCGKVGYKQQRRKRLLNGGFLELRYTFHTHCGNKRRNKRIEHVRTSSSLPFQLQ